jgi:hypothetical protein
MVALTALGLARQISNFGYHLEETQAPVSFHRIPKALPRQPPTTAPRPISTIGSPNNSTLRFLPHHKTTLASDNPSIFVYTQSTSLPLLDHHVHSSSLQVGYLPAQMAHHHPPLRPWYGLRPLHSPHLHRPDIHLWWSKIHPCTGLLLPNM